MRRVLVTGATGFLGRSLVRRLVADGFQVTALARAAVSPFADEVVEYLRADLADGVQAAAALAPWRWDAVANLAGPVTGGAEDWTTGVAVVHAHVRLALHLRHAMPSSARLVQASSMTVYGAPQVLPIDEHHPRQPLHLYGLAKSLAEDVWLSAPERDVWVLRLPGLFSEQRRTGALYHFCRAAQRGEPLRVTAPVPTPWDLLHVDDAADAIARALQANERAAGALNIGYGAPVELGAIATWIAAHAGAGSAVEQPTGVIHPVFQLDTTRARQRLAWDPGSLHDRLARLYTAYRDEVP